MTNFPSQLQLPMRRILQAFERGEKLTTAQGNRLGRTVDFRKIVSRLREAGYPIKDYWMEMEGRRFKVYFKEN